MAGAQMGCARDGYGEGRIGLNSRVRLCDRLVSFPVNCAASVYITLEMHQARLSFKPARRQSCCCLLQLRPFLVQRPTSPESHLR